jgi:hypothetical protein
VSWMCYYAVCTDSRLCVFMSADGLADTELSCVPTVVRINCSEHVRVSSLSSIVARCSYSDNVTPTLLNTVRYHSCIEANSLSVILHTRLNL